MVSLEISAKILPQIRPEMNKDDLGRGVAALLGYYLKYNQRYCIFSYNENNQLSSITIKSTWEEYEDGEKEKGSYTDKYTFSYSGKRLTRVVDSWEEIDDHKDKGRCEYTLKYDSDYDNPFYQYTPKVVDYLMDMEGLEAFAYLGLLGRASSKLPTSISYEEEEYCQEDGKTEYYNSSTSCGPYRYNSYGALSSADGYSYSYTTIETRAAGDMWLPMPKQDKVRRMFTRPSNRRKNK